MPFNWSLTFCISGLTLLLTLAASLWSLLWAEEMISLAASTDGAFETLSITFSMSLDVLLPAFLTASLTLATIDCLVARFSTVSVWGKAETYQKKENMMLQIYWRENILFEFEWMNIPNDRRRRALMRKRKKVSLWIFLLIRLQNQNNSKIILTICVE